MIAFIPVPPSADLIGLRERNEQRLAEAKARLGTKWVLHPANSLKRTKVKK